jgi:hypothetical protein
MTIPQRAIALYQESAETIAKPPEKLPDLLEVFLRRGDRSCYLHMGQQERSLVDRGRRSQCFDKAITSDRIKADGVC